MKIVLIALFVFLVVFLGVAVGVQNEQWVEVNYVFGVSEMHLSTLISLSLLAGFVFSFILLGGFLLKTKLQIRILRKRLKQHTASE